jgi:superfamily II DNA/RNA helicase
VAEALEPKEEKLSKQEKKKLDLLEHYSEKEIKEMLAYIANSTKKEVDEVLNEP